MIRTAIVNTTTGFVEIVLSSDNPIPQLPPEFGPNYLMVVSDVVNVGWIWNGVQLAAPAPPAPTPDEIRTASFIADAGRADLLTRLNTATPAQIDAFVDSTVTTLPAARTLFKAIIKAIALSIRN